MSIRPADAPDAHALPVTLPYRLVRCPDPDCPPFAVPALCLRSAELRPVVCPWGHRLSPDPADGGGSDPDDPPPPLPPGVRLGPRAHQVLGRLLRGDSEKQAARRLGMNPHTVHAHVKTIHERLAVCSRGELLSRFVNAG